MDLKDAATAAKTPFYLLAVSIFAFVASRTVCLYPAARIMLPAAALPKRILFWTFTPYGWRLLLCPGENLRQHLFVGWRPRENFLHPDRDGVIGSPSLAVDPHMRPGCGGPAKEVLSETNGSMTIVRIFLECSLHLLRKCLRDQRR